MKITRVLFPALFVVLFLTQVGSGDEPRKTFVLVPGNSPSKILSEVRQWRNASPANAIAPVRIDVRPGTYRLDETLVLKPGDGHMEWQGSGDVLFTRGKNITGWKKNAQGRFVATIPEVASGKWWFEQLFVNGRRATPAKTPNEFYYFIEDQVECLSDPATGTLIDTSRRAFMPRQEQRDLFEKIADSVSKDRPANDIRVKFYHSWETSLHRLANYNTKSNTALLTGDARWTLAYWKRGGLRYQIEGIPEALDAPGEFLLERNGRLTYIPREGETLETLDVIAPFGPGDGENSAILKISGQVDKIASCENNQSLDPALLINDLTFSGITFAHDPFILPEEGMSSSQSAVLCPAAILVEAAQNINFIRCNVAHTGGYGIWFHRACRHCRVEQCLLEDLGAGGIRIGTHMRGIETQNDHLVSGHVSVIDNIVRDYGRIDGGGIGIWIGAADNNRVFHNEVCDGLYTGISIGWVWGYAPSRAFNNKIEFNHIHHIGQGVLSDMGAVYTLGISPGTTVSNNVIHHVRSYNHYGGGGLGLYTDEGSSQIVFENNLIYNTHTAVIHQHYGQENIFRNNILAFPFQRGAISRSRIEEHLSYTAERNIIVCDRTPFFTGNWNDNEHFSLRNNLYCLMKANDWEDETQGHLFNKQTFQEWQAKGNDV
ncbi:MAG: right-handed parallel beta-helix repeat-containing protein, partial [Thermoguttaceae bacterium]|nr:right-handed parallel beta-helix repeat-containing protein [Thermoguttaceae bacterium]